jgi:hypothetical protein
VNADALIEAIEGDIRIAGEQLDLPAFAAVASHPYLHGDDSVLGVAATTEAAGSTAIAMNLP